MKKAKAVSIILLTIALYIVVLSVAHANNKKETPQQTCETQLSECNAELDECIATMK